MWPYPVPVWRSLCLQVSRNVSLMLHLLFKWLIWLDQTHPENPPFWWTQSHSIANLIMKELYHYTPLVLLYTECTQEQEPQGPSLNSVYHRPTKVKWDSDWQEDIKYWAARKTKSPTLEKQKLWDWPRLSLTSLPIQIMLHFLNETQNLNISNTVGGTSSKFIWNSPELEGKFFRNILLLSAFSAISVVLPLWGASLAHLINIFWLAVDSPFFLRLEGHSLI